MKLLFDQNLSHRLCLTVAASFPGSSHVRELGLERATDRELWDFAGRNRFALVTQDADFAEMAVLLGPPPKVVWLRCGNRPTAEIERILGQFQLLQEFARDDSAACLELY